MTAKNRKTKYMQKELYDKVYFRNIRTDGVSRFIFF